MNNRVKVGDRIEMREPYEVMGVKIGDKATVLFIDHDGTFLAEFDRKINGHSGNGKGKDPHCCWLGTYRNFVIIDENHTEQKIVITADGNVTLARLYDGKTVIKSATAKCSPDDKFDFATGARIAFDRLIGEEKTEQEQKWRVVNRKAKVGDYIRIKGKPFYFNHDGEILKVDAVAKTIVRVYGRNHNDETCASNYLWNYYLGSECEVVEPVTEEEPLKEEPTKYYNGKVVCVRTGHSWFTVGKVYDVIDGVITADDGDQYPKCGEEPYKDAEDIRHAGCLDTPRHNRTNEFIPLVE